VTADLLVARVTGQQRAGDVAVQVNLIMTDRALFNRSEEPAVLLGAGPIPAAHARRLVHEPGPQVPRWIRRLYRAPRTGELMAMDARARCFTPTQRHFIELRELQLHQRINPRREQPPRRPRPTRNFRRVTEGAFSQAVSTAE
jgi:hypothetical protein